MMTITDYINHANHAFSRNAQYYQKYRDMLLAKSEMNQQSKKNSIISEKNKMIKKRN